LYSINENDNKRGNVNFVEMTNKLFHDIHFNGAVLATFFDHGMRY